MSQLLRRFACLSCSGGSCVSAAQKFCMSQLLRSFFACLSCSGGSREDETPIVRVDMKCFVATQQA